MGDPLRGAAGTVLGDTYLPDHRAPVVDQLGQHHGHIVIDGGGVVGPLCRVAHKCAKREYGRTAYLQEPGTARHNSAQAGRLASAPATFSSAQSSFTNTHCPVLPVRTEQSGGGQKEGSPWPQLEGLVTGCTGGNFWDQKSKPGTMSAISDRDPSVSGSGDRLWKGTASEHKAA